ncbi:MAG: phospho-sugar mutase [Pirellulaceae bacterium]|jgi:phosphoglucomutase/phosphomannomutase|nr:phospho-sugar mutase [Pirellulaceae bacterium]MDP7017360.1 phospho-sugar mutase [Pirellulaceae bacterium]
MNVSAALARIDDAVGRQHLTAAAADNVRTWLTEDRYAEYRDEVLAHIDAGQWQALDDAFWTVIPFGTGGRRGRMYPIGCNAINDRTIGESAQGLAEYVKSQVDSSELRCAIAYDTRHNSRKFAELCAEVMVAAGFEVVLLDEHRSTPELSYLVRRKHCSCGIMVTASHNPPSDNAVKVYWSTGAQVLPPHDEKIIEGVMNVQEILRVPFQEAVASGKVQMVTEETDAAYLSVVVGERFDGPRDLRVLFSPLHGVGATSVEPVLREDGFDVAVFPGHAEPSGDFPNVPDNVSNPENPAVFDAIVEYAVSEGYELALATDPDADRMGCAAPLTWKTGSPWRTLTGNQLGALLADFVIEQRGSLTPDHYVVTTLVTTGMIRRIATSYGITTYDNLLVGFKWICGQMDDAGPDRFLFGTEESHGYLTGQYARDKDGAVACMLISEMAAKLKAEGLTLHEKLDSLYWQHGCHVERLLNVKMAGSEGMSRMQALMDGFRTEPPTEIGGAPIARMRDYANGRTTIAGGATEPLDGPRGNLIIFDLAETGNSVAVRPSGTEPKVKFYMFGYTPAEQLADLDDARAELNQRLDQMEEQLKALA